MKNKPFGLKIAVEKSILALKEGKAPTSVILGNLFVLQKAVEFPKSLDTAFFSISRYNPTEEERKAIVKLMDILKQPSVNQQEQIEKTFEGGWVTKKSPPIKVFHEKKKVFEQRKPNPKTPTQKPTVVVKKSKIWFSIDKTYFLIHNKQKISLSLTQKAFLLT